MLDLTLRPLKDEALRRPAHALAPLVKPIWLTGLSLLASVLTAVLAWQGHTALAVATWLLGRVFDGLDGLVARLRQEVQDFGGYLDIVGDTVGYTLIPLGIALGVDTRSAWIATAVLLGSFYLNAVSWTYLSALLEKRGRGASSSGEVTSVAMPPALVEGTETIIFFTLFLALPALAPWLFSVMAVAVVVGVGQRLFHARELT